MVLRARVRAVEAAAFVVLGRAGVLAARAFAVLDAALFGVAAFAAAFEGAREDVRVVPVAVSFPVDRVSRNSSARFTML